MPETARLPYLVRLGLRLTAGLTEMSPERRQRHVAFVLKQQTVDGGFTGREGDADLYYTSFAVRTLVMLNALDEPCCQSLANYLRSFDPEQLGVIDMMNWLSTALALQTSGGIDLLASAALGWNNRMAAKLESVRTSDGGYAKSSEGASGSTYHSFLVLLAYQLLGKPLPRRNALIQFLYDRQREDGGYVEIGPMRRSGTNPTAAGAAILKELGAMDAETTGDLRAFFKDMRGGEGGFQANGRVPFCDGLSSFTGLLTCQDLGFPEILDLGALRQWVETQLEFPTGGFRAAAWDESADVEYTFYGLGLIGLLNAPTHPAHS